MASLQLRVLGGFAAVEPSGRPVEISGKKNQVLLTYLALHPDKKLTREKLASLLWSDRDEAQARSSLRQALAALRRDLAGIQPPPLAVDGNTVALDGSAVSTDVAAFEGLATSDSAEELRRAAKLYEGDLLDGMAVRDPAFNDWLTFERGRLREVAIGALMRLMAHLSGTEAIATGQRLVALDPLREASHHALMRVYAAQGQFEQAIRQHHYCRDTLRRELNLDPSAKIESLYREIREGKYVGRPATASAEAGEPASPLPEKPSIAVLPFENRSDDPALPALVLLDKPSIAVLPFANMSGDPGQEYFADGLTEDITTALSRVSGLTVIARTSSLGYKGQRVDVKRIAKELGVRYVMEGSVRRAGDRARVTAQLIDGITGHHVWAERYDRPAGDIFDVQDDITRSVAATTETQIQLSERLVNESRVTGEPKAGALVMRAWGIFYDFTLEALVEAADLAKQAIRLAPMNPRAHIILARAHVYRLWFGVIADNKENVALGLRLAESGIRLAPRDEWAHFCMAGALEMAGRTGEAVAECQRAIELNPNFSAGYAGLGRNLAASGQPREAIEACRMALRLNPRDPTNWERHSSLAICHFVAGDDEAAAREARTAAQARPELPEPLIILAAAASAQGKIEEAQFAVAQCLARWPDIRLGNIMPIHIPQLTRSADRGRLLEMLRKAGLAE